MSQRVKAPRLQQDGIERWEIGESIDRDRAIDEHGFLVSDMELVTVRFSDGETETYWSTDLVHFGSREKIIQGEPS